MRKEENEQMPEGNFEYCFDFYTIHGNHPCECGDDYCRCGTIEGVDIHSVNVQEVLEKIVSNFDDGKITDFDKYCIERICIAKGIYTPDSFEIDKKGGYYGEELIAIRLECGPRHELVKQIETMLCLVSNKEKLFLCLNLEYGKILPALEECEDFSIEEINRDDIVVGNSFCEKIKNNPYNSAYDGIIGLFTDCNGKYRLIDGNHRYLASKGKEKVKIVLAK
jgi:hypothetical protein